MDCKDAARLLEADVDGELDLVRHLELEVHVKTCPACAQRRNELTTFRANVQSGLPRHTASAAFLARLRTQIAEMDEVEDKTVPPKKSSRLYFPSWVNAVGLAASVAIALVAGYSWGNSHGAANQIVNAAIDDHVRSLEANHLMDVVSTDQHTVKPWFAGKLDFAPPVLDLADVGFPLAGGRLETIEGQTAAALVYRRRQHAINILVWPNPGTGLAEQQRERKGYAVNTWTEGGFNFTAVSEIPLQELNHFCEEFRRRQRAH